MIKIETVQACDVRAGDSIYNSSAAHPAFAWTRVLRVTRRDDQTVVISTIDFDTWKHPMHAVAVRRRS